MGNFKIGLFFVGLLIVIAAAFYMGRKSGPVIDPSVVIPVNSEAVQQAVKDAEVSADAADIAAGSARRAADSTLETAKSAAESASDAAKSAKDAARTVAGEDPAPKPTLPEKIK